MKITKKDWERVRDTMRKYQRKEGYVDEVDGKLMFFDTDPFCNFVHACYVTYENVEKYIADCEQ